MFAAAGGFRDDAPPRQEVNIIMGERGHASIAKAARVLGVPVVTVPPADVGAGCVDVGQLDEAVGKAQASGVRYPIVCATLGGTVNGHVDDLAALGQICQRRGAWFHVDAIWGAALAYSADETARAFLSGLEHADSVALGPQKWMFTPRLCALTLFPKLLSPPEFDARLAAVMPYSAKREGESDVATHNRGTWGLQGSRRADCLPLWATLQVLGRAGVRRYVDDSLALTREFHILALSQVHASAALRVAPTHTPQLNLLTLRANYGEKDLALELQSRLHARGEGWVSVSAVGGEHLLRCVLTNPELKLKHCAAMLESLKST
eukprot:gnl/TRDRNA2_/TRDRNA2_104398_c0_seq1.p1 gnl/TRDRNA2_/TRDRNA2_104398_c0~~gnl/TRDRNA2_/TRDRNA2_104398_c0_seq1.p1  ORF type:complete len:344 (+),score=43.52 gnl/TRDRNA2_/TRDRNA2_104398_c0_seq1:71-1033(+)